MIWLIRQIIRSYPTWDRPPQIALVSALILLVPTVIIAFAAPETVRPFAWFGAGMLLLTAQIAVMWGSRGMVGVVTLAQRAYLAGDLARARTLLEGLRAKERADFRALTLLGNVYRQEGRLDDSLTILYEAVDKDSNHPFPLVGIGRTLIAMGDYAAAAETLERALASDAPSGVWIDLAEAYMRAGRPDDARAALERAPESLSEASAALMAAWLRYQVGGGDAPDPTTIAAGLPFWRAAAARFAQTPYGAALADDLRAWDS
jgi:predicted Zn-dependent protease